MGKGWFCQGRSASFCGDRTNSPYAFGHRRTGYFLPGGAVNHLPKKFLQVAQNSRTEIRADATT